MERSASARSEPSGFYLAPLSSPPTKAKTRRHFSVACPSGHRGDTRIRAAVNENDHGTADTDAPEGMPQDVLSNLEGESVVSSPAPRQAHGRSRVRGPARRPAAQPCERLGPILA